MQGTLGGSSQSGVSASGQRTVQCVLLVKVKLVVLVKL